jgi:hypothetical protein
LVTEEDQRYCEQQQPDTTLRNDDVNEPLEQQRREQREKAASRDAQETGQVPVEKRPNLFDQPGEFSRQPVRASLLHIGMDDYTLHPFVRPGAFVRIDPRQRRIPAVDWHSDHDRPIFFVELRERYVCSWCEMHDGRLILIPSHQSKRRTQHVRYPAEATIIGRVTGVTMDLVELSENEARA